VARTCPWNPYRPILLYASGLSRICLRSADANLDLGRTAASPVLRRFQGVHLSCPSLDIQSEHLRQEEGVKTLIGRILI
jgi:hypothetical protein